MNTVNNKPKLIAMPMAHGKTTMARRFPDLFVDIDAHAPQLKGPAAWQDRRDALETGDWSKVNEQMISIILDAITDLNGRTILVHTAYPELKDQYDMSYISPMPWDVIRTRLEKREGNKDGQGLSQVLQLGQTNLNAHHAAMDDLPLPEVWIDPHSGAVHNVRNSARTISQGGSSS